jgi:hypothetical protein
VSEEQKGAYLVGQLERARREWPWVGVMNVWFLRYGGYREPDPADPTPYFAVVTRDYAPLPAYDALKEYAARPPEPFVARERPLPWVWLLVPALLIGGLVVVCGLGSLRALGSLRR